MESRSNADSRRSLRRSANSLPAALDCLRQAGKFPARRGRDLQQTFENTAAGRRQHRLIKGDPQKFPCEFRCG
jgi:hypothetical protein